VSTTLIVVLIAIVVIIALIVVGFGVARRRGSSQLRERFGPEYDRAMEQSGDRKSAERELEARQERRQQLEIRPLDAVARNRYTNEWRDVQARFVDSPQQAIREADLLVVNLMRDRGYPMEEFDQRAADLSVDHPNEVADYRAAHSIAQRSSDGGASTDDQREALQRYRSLFDSLLRAD
jgi:FtsZ-interacting cell division protein ZipA